MNQYHISSIDKGDLEAQLKQKISNNISNQSIDQKVTIKNEKNVIENNNNPNQSNNQNNFIPVQNTSLNPNLNQQSHIDESVPISSIDKGDLEVIYSNNKTLLQLNNISNQNINLLKNRLNFSEFKKINPNLHQSSAPIRPSISIDKPNSNNENSGNINTNDNNLKDPLISNDSNSNSNNINKLIINNLNDTNDKALLKLLDKVDDNYEKKSWKRYKCEILWLNVIPIILYVIFIVFLVYYFEYTPEQIEIFINEETKIYKQLYKEAVELNEKNMTAEAIIKKGESLVHALKAFYWNKSTTNDELTYAIGNIYYETENKKEAEIFYNLTLIIAPTNQEVTFSKGNIYFDQAIIGINPIFIFLSCFVTLICWMYRFNAR